MSQPANHEFSIHGIGEIALPVVEALTGLLAAVELTRDHTWKVKDGHPDRVPLIFLNSGDHDPKVLKKY